MSAPDAPTREALIEQAMAPIRPVLEELGLEIEDNGSGWLPVRKDGEYLGRLEIQLRYSRWGALKLEGLAERPYKLRVFEQTINYSKPDKMIAKIRESWGPEALAARREAERRWRQAKDEQAAKEAARRRVQDAAEEMLAALERLLAATPAGNEAEHEPGCRCVIHEARAAIRKAKGEAP